YYGMWVPHTFMPKAPTTEGHGGMSGAAKWLLGGVNEIVKFIQSTGGIAGLILVALSMLFKAYRTAALFLVYVFCIGLFFLKYAGGDWMAGYRFLVPVLPLYLIALVLGLKSVADRVFAASELSSGKQHLAIVLILLTAGLFNLNETYKFVRDKKLYPNFVMTSEDMIGPGKWIDERYPETHQLAVLRMGAVAYYSRLQIIDLFGLADKTIGRLKYDGTFNRKALHAYLAERRPELFMHDERKALGSTLEFNGLQYKAIKQFPQGSLQWWTLFERVSEL
ncbi:MAG: hypothetical protein AAF492_21765, partial [Verrucomicrobiota bacterium]